jgi:hypothetical protein
MMIANRKLFERAMMGALAAAIPAALITTLAGPHVSLFGPKLGLFIHFGITGLLMLLGAFLAIKRVQPFRWLERRLGL